MIAGVHGRLITASFARAVLPSLPGAAAPMPVAVARALRALSERIDATLGPASNERAITDTAVLPLLRTLGYHSNARVDAADGCWLDTSSEGVRGPLVGVFDWSEPLHRVWRPAVIRAIASAAEWCLCCNGRSLRIVDARRTWSRDYLESDLRALASSDEALSLLWVLLRSPALAATPPLLDVAAGMSARHGVEVCRALGDGVLLALTTLLEALSASR